MGAKHAPLTERLWAKIKKAGPNDCWIWTASVNSYGYGQVWGGANVRKLLRAHRVAYEDVVGKIPRGILVLHKCDNPPCCNPSHLFLGTDADNVADRVAKGRTRRGDQRGEKHGSAKLTERQVLAIRAAMGPQKVIAARYGINQSGVSDIKRRKLWAHIPDAVGY